MRQTALLLLLSVAAAAPDDARRMRPDHAPAPFTAQEWRKACPEGRADTFRVEIRDEKPTKHTMKFLKGDEETAEVELTNATEEGEVLKTWKDRQRWVDFQAQGSFPEVDTKITEETIEVPGGKFECWLYTVQKRTGDVATVRIWFAKKLPGPPVKMTSEEKGKIVFTMTLLEHKEPEVDKAPEKEEASGGG